MGGIAQVLQMRKLTQLGKVVWSIQDSERVHSKGKIGNQGTVSLSSLTASGQK